MEISPCVILPTLQMEERSRPFLVNFNHFFLVSDLFLIFCCCGGVIESLGEGGIEPATQKKHYKTKTTSWSSE